VELADIHAIGELVKKFDERGKPFDGGLDLGLKDLDVIFALYFLEVNKDWLRGDRSDQDRCGRCETVGEWDS
jgi:hypothetical protein